MKPKRVVIIGGGISGLAAAHRLAQRSRQSSDVLEIILLEAKDSFGGVIQTDRQDGFLLEAGPESFISNKPWALDLCRELGLGSSLMETQSVHRRSFLVRQGKLLPIPEGF